MFAVIRTGGKQYKVSKDDVIKVEKLDAEPGSQVDLSEVMFIGGDNAAKVGNPFIKGAQVKAEVLEQKKAPKVTIFKRKRRQGYRKTIGHRQPVTVLKIKDIKAAYERENHGT